jgi:hypothetical protein
MHHRASSTSSLRQRRYRSSKLTVTNLLMELLFIQVWEFTSFGQSYARTLAGVIVTEHANSA